jgi:hypothetical protein
MIQVDDKNKFHMTGDDVVKESSRISIALIELTRKLNDMEPKLALSFLRVVHTMTNGLAKPIVDQMDKEADARLKGKMKEKREEKKRRKALKEAAMNGIAPAKNEVQGNIVKLDMTKEENKDGDTEQCDTTSGNATDAGQFDSIRSDKSATGSSSDGR